MASLPVVRHSSLAESPVATSEPTAAPPSGPSQTREIGVHKSKRAAMREPRVPPIVSTRTAGVAGLCSCCRHGCGRGDFSADSPRTTLRFVTPPLDNNDVTRDVICAAIIDSSCRTALAYIQQVRAASKPSGRQLIILRRRPPQHPSPIGRPPQAATVGRRRGGRHIGGGSAVVASFGSQAHGRRGLAVTPQTCFGFGFGFGSGFGLGFGLGLGLGWLGSGLG